MITRRQFLQFAGVGFAAAGLELGLPATPAYGRMLSYNPPFLPDSVQPILGYTAGWVRLTNGEIPETYIQPMLPMEAAPIKSLPTWVEVAAPYAAARAWCAPDAPLVERLGHGAVLYADKILDDSAKQFWLRVALRDEQSAWVQMAHLRQALLPSVGLASGAVLEKNGQLTLYAAEKRLFTLAVGVSQNLPSGVYRILEKRPAQHTPTHSGVPWLLMANGGLALHGVHWHNDFATPAAASVELSAFAAKLLYASLIEGSKITLR